MIFDKEINRKRTKRLLCTKIDFLRTKTKIIFKKKEKKEEVYSTLLIYRFLKKFPLFSECINNNENRPVFAITARMREKENQKKSNENLAF